MQMTAERFDELVANTRLKPDSKGRQAARLQLVDGLSQRDAAAQAGCTHTTVKQAVASIYKAGGLTTLAVTVPVDKVDALAQWLAENGGGI